MAGIASDAQAALVAAVRRAVHGGEMVTMVAEAALTTRPTIYRMLKSADEPGPGLKNRRGSIGKGSPEWGRYVDASAVVAEMRRQKMVPNPGG